MITHLIIENFVLVERLELDFSAGLQVLTGETGAGKSLIVGAIDLIFGGAPKPGSLFDETHPAVLEGTFTVDERNPDVIELIQKYDILLEENELFFRREIQTNLRTRCFVNGRRVAVGIVKEFGAVMLDFHSQRDQQKLFDPAFQLQMLDRYGDTTQQCEDFTASYHALQELSKTLRRKIKQEQEQAQKQELYRYQLNELQALELQPGEDEQLQAELELLTNAEDILLLSQETEQLLFEQEHSVYDVVSEITQRWQRYHEGGPSVVSAVSHLQDALAHLQDAVEETRSLSDSVDVDMERQQQVEARLDAINSMKAKFHRDVPQLLEYMQEIAEQITRFGSHQAEIEGLKKEETRATAALIEQARNLSIKRRKAARKFEEELKKHIRQLAIPDAQVKILFDKEGPVEKEINSLVNITETGADSIDYYFSANVGVRMQPLRVAASGGELSRFLLTVKKVLSDKMAQRLIVFDEIDSGIGGKTADLLGDFIEAISHDHQILCISHLPQIAACAHRHFVIRKQRNRTSAAVVVEQVARDKRTEEIARMLSGSQSETALQHAAEILRKKRN
jgi:DNA repair protein RecN (Recombination protein N)